MYTRKRYRRSCRGNKTDNMVVKQYSSNKKTR